MKKTVLFLFLLLASKLTYAQQNILSEQAEMSVLTIGPGTSLNDSFGHSAFRIKDPVKGIDVVFNYGVYDFNTPHFYTKFAQGKLNYLMGLNYYEDFFEAYTSQNRSIKEQVLNLSQTEKQKLFNYLLNNYKPENRAYLYDFFYDNCATKMRDVLQNVLNNAIVFNKPQDFQPKTFRTLIQENLYKNSWGSLGIDVALGSVIDKKTSAGEEMFLPENIHKFFEIARIKNTNKPLVKENKVLYKAVPMPKPTNFFTSPLVVFGIIGLFILYITYTDFKKHTRSRWLDVTLFSITGLVGILILLLWFATDHKGTHQNYNLLWAFVLNIFVMGQVVRVNPSAWFVRYLKFLVILLCLLTFHWIVGVQVFAIGLIPLLIALLVRYVFLIGFYKADSIEL
ncbi:MAG TPA: DUF4105 domain-containing protein [Mariniflexile sp.]|nr:DUF4105 domain-containing protein [Mariniflexile sp.]